MRNKVFWFLSILFSLIVAYRGDTPDTAQYIKLFNEIDDVFINPFEFYQRYGVEWLYGVLSWLVKILLGDVRFLFFIISLSHFILLKIIAKRIGVSLGYIYVLYLPSYYLLQQFTQYRQSFALMISLLAAVFYLQNERLKGLIAAFFSAFIHVSAAPFFLAVVIADYIFMREKISFKKFSTVCYLVIIIIFAISRLMSDSNFLFQIERLNDYASDADFSQARDFFSLPNIRAFVLCTSFIFFGKYKDSIFAKIVLAYSFSVGLRFGFYDFMVINGRLAGAFSYFEILLMPIMIKDFTVNFFLRWLLLLTYALISVYLVLEHQIPNFFDDYVRGV